MAGVDLKTVQELLGHKSIEMTLRYSHLSPDHKKQAVDLLCKRIDTIWTPTTHERVRVQEHYVEEPELANTYDSAPVAQEDRAAVS